MGAAPLGADFTCRGPAAAADRGDSNILGPPRRADRTGWALALRLSQNGAPGGAAHGRAEIAPRKKKLKRSLTFGRC